MADAEFSATLPTNNNLTPAQMKTLFSLPLDLRNMIVEGTVGNINSWNDSSQISWGNMKLGPCLYTHLDVQCLNNLLQLTMLPIWLWA